MQLEFEFANTGAELTVTSVLHHAMILVEHDGISAAILDHAIGEDNCSRLYERLRERGIPFIIYTGHVVPEEDRKGGMLIPKPALPGILVAAVEELMRVGQIQTETLPVRSVVDRRGCGPSDAPRT